VRPAAALVLLALLALPAAAGAAGGEGFAEYEVKAAFVRNFVKFVEWPAKPGTLTLCILGEDPFAGAFAGPEDAGGGRKLVPRRIGRPEESADCQVLFLPAAQKERLADVLAATGDKPVLTIGDLAGQAKAGLVLSFLVEEKKVRFEVNLEPARRTGLVISSKLLGLAKAVHNPR